MARSKVKMNSGTKRSERAKEAEQGQKRKKAYLEVKRRALSYEKENYTQLVAIKSNNGDWWKLVGHSAIIYKYMVAPRLRLKPKLMPDSDYDEKSEEGVISIPDIDKFEEGLKVGKIFLINSTKWTKVFDLGERVSEEDYRLMVQEDEMRLKMANRLIQPVEKMPELNNKVKALLNVVHPNVRKMEGVAREVFGVEMEKRVVESQMMVLRAARGTTDVETCLAKTYDMAEDLYGYILVMINLRLLEPKIIYNMAEAVVALESQIKKELSKRAIKQVDEEIKDQVKQLRKTNKTKDGDGKSNQPDTGGANERVDISSDKKEKKDGPTGN